VVRGLTVNVGSAAVTNTAGSTATMSVGDTVMVYATASSGNVLTAVKIMVAPAKTKG
jgi:hypothetical protein